MVVLSVYIPTNSGRLFLFLHTLSEFFVDIFDDGLSDQCEVALTCVSLLISPFWLSLRPLIFFYWVVCSFYIFWRFIPSVAADGIYSSVYISIPNLQSEISPHTSQNVHLKKST